MKVLLATDGSEPARAALELLEAMGRRGDVAVTALAVASLGPTAPDWPPRHLEALIEKDREHAQSIATGTAKQLADLGFEAHAETAEGHPGERIVEVIQRGDYDLTLLGGFRHRWFGARLLGSTGTYVLHASPSSVLLVNEPPSERIRCRVLVATDGSAAALVAASAFGRFADPERCRVVVLSVTDLVPRPDVVAYPTEIMHTYPLVGYAPEEYEELDRLARSRAEAAVAETAEHLRAAGFFAEERVAIGPPRPTVLDEASNGAFELVVVGSRGLGPVRRAFLGSISEPVARHTRAALIGRREPSPSEPS